MTTYIYTLSDPRDGNIRYVGKTNSPKHRLSSHINGKGLVNESGRKSDWVSELKIANLLPTMEIIEEVSDEDWSQREKHWISTLKNQGYDLLNSDRRIANVKRRHAHKKEESKPVLLRLSRKDVERLDNLARDLKAPSRTYAIRVLITSTYDSLIGNQAMSIILDSSFGVPAKIETLPNKEEEVPA